MFRDRALRRTLRRLYPGRDVRAMAALYRDAGRLTAADVAALVALDDAGRDRMLRQRYRAVGARDAALADLAVRAADVQWCGCRRVVAGEV